MPWIFLAVKLEAGKPIIEILEKTPQVPDTCQWCIFLRNHDELTLETVTDIERDYMYDEYAVDKAMRINLGIRRRLAPMMENDRRRVELLTGCSSPCRELQSSITATKSGWAITFTLGIATECARRCNGTADGMRGFRRRIRTACIRR